MKIRSLSKMAVRRPVRRIFDAADNAACMSADICPQEKALKTMASGSADNRRFSLSATAPVLRTEVPLSRRGHNCPQGFQADKCPLQNPKSWPLSRWSPARRVLLARRSEQSRLRRGVNTDARHDLLGGPNFLCITLTRSFVTIPPWSRCAPGCPSPLPGGREQPFAASPSLGRLLRSRHGRPRRVARGSRQVALVRQKLVGSRTFIPSHVEHGHGRRCATLWPFGVRHVHP
jgi:hypothetical protein